MTERLPFLPATVALNARQHQGERSVSLVEASAGTGKTYNLCELYVRYIVERALLPSQILVVTFTEAATEELSDRIRRRLRECAHMLAASNPEGAVRLQQAILHFDEAYISTIHGFCQRVLRDFSLECGQSPVSEIEENATIVWQQCAEAFWRAHLQNTGPFVSAFIGQGEFSPEALAKALEVVQCQPSVKIVPQAPVCSVDELESLFAQLFSSVCAQVQSLGFDGIFAALSACALKPSVSLPDVRAQADALAQMADAYLRGTPMPAAAMLEAVGTFATENLGACVDKRKHRQYQFPADPLTEACTAFTRLTKTARVSLFQYFFAFAKDYHRQQVEQTAQHTYHDLIQGVYHAVRKSPALKQALCKQIHAVMIDEFQDTDPWQWGIFGEVFGGALGPPLWLIGDPKQAIYRFRGADIFTYLKAAHACGENSYALTCNYRSAPMLVKALNALFLASMSASKQTKNPFLSDAIFYTAVTPARKAGGLCAAGFHPAPLQCFIDSAASSRTTQVLTEQLCNLVTDEIVRLLQTDACQLDGRPLRANDIAILVRTNIQGQAMLQALRARGIACTARTNEKVFESVAADLLAQWFALMADPENPDCARGFAYTLARACDTMVADTHQKAARLPTLTQSARWEALWSREGIAAALDACARDSGLLSGALNANNMRLLTDWAHLCELLAMAEAAEGLSAEGLRKWFFRQRSVSKETVRIDNDANAVRVQTIHSSKGLEYPVVFCPFLGDGLRWETPEQFIDDEDAFCVALSADDVDRSFWETQSLAEDVRLLYVALTRARERLYVYWPEKRTSASRSASVEKTAMGLLLGVKTYDEGLNRLQAIQAASGGDDCLHIETIPQIFPSVPVSAPLAPEWAKIMAFRGNISWVLRTASFSSLTRHHGETASDLAQDYDAQVMALPPADRAQDAIAAFPQGAAAGVFFHEIFELADYQLADKRDDLIVKRAQAAGLAQADLRAFSTMLDRVLTTPLGASLTWRLCDLQPADRVHELRFALASELPSPAALADVFAQHASHLPENFIAYMRGLSPRALDGCLTGSIDLLMRADGRFWVADWKSNRLGENAEAYGAAAIEQAMCQHAYFLQYHLYVCAADAWLRTRLPGYEYEKDFGGVFYVFVRGVRAQVGGSGVYFDRPTADCLQALRQCLHLKGGL